MRVQIKVRKVQKIKMTKRCNPRTLNEKNMTEMECLRKKIT